MLQHYHIEDMLDKVAHGKVIREELELINKAITVVLNKAIKRIEGLSRNILYSKMKEVKRAQMLYSRMKVK